MNRYLADLQRPRSEARQPQRFKLGEVMNACPGWPEPAYRTFLTTPSVGNPDRDWPYFQRNRDGSCCLTMDWRP